MTTPNYWSPQPGTATVNFVPDYLIGGDFPIATETGIIAAGQVLQRGTVLGQQLLSQTITSSAGANTGNGTIGALSVGTTAKIGAYKLVATGPTSFAVTDPAGVALPVANVGTAYADAEIGFRVTAGSTAFAAGDSFTLTISAPAQITASAGTNTGNGSIGSLSVLSGAQTGNYVATFSSPTSFTVTDPLGRTLASGAVGVAFANQIGFTISAGGVAFVAGDSFAIDNILPPASGFYTIATAAATDGSQVPCAILAESIDTTPAGTNGPGAAPLYLTGEFDANAVIWGAGLSATPLVVAQLRQVDIFLKQSILGDVVL
jgi:hypothetical protein